METNRTQRVTKSSMSIRRPPHWLQKYGESTWHRSKTMKRSIALSAGLMMGLLGAGAERAGAAVYCKYAGYPAHCVERPGGVVAPAYQAGGVPPSIEPRPTGFFKQDLFDRNNPNNLRSDWPSPRAQP